MRRPPTTKSDECRPSARQPATTPTTKAAHDEAEVSISPDPLGRHLRPHQA